MKKVLITMAVLTGMVAGTMVFSSFVAPKQEETRQQIRTNVTDRTVASNLKCPCRDNSGRTCYYWIDVYASDNACYSYYAIVRGDRSETPYTVIQNSTYGDDDTSVGFHGEKAGNYHYYIIYNDYRCYFNL